MRRSASTAFAASLRAFFAQHLPLTRGLSPRTVLSYRDTFVLLLRYLATWHRCDVVDLTLDHVSAAEVLAFLDHLESDRKNSVATRNARLAAIHSFVRFAATREPEHVEHCQRVLAVPDQTRPHQGYRLSGDARDPCDARHHPTQRTAERARPCPPAHPLQYRRQSPGAAGSPRG
jgi:hypothetical protein